MCGICGFNWRDGALVAAMSRELTHRGPDQEGSFCAEGVSLGHRRLSIIDLSDHGRQPMANEDGSVQLVFNGEIYNFRELRDDLEKRGHVFRSRADSEVIVHAYAEYVRDCVQRLRGMFAFAIWDAPRQTLFLARDRIGIKPLYYHWRDGRFLFASEIKAILACDRVGRGLNRQALVDYLGFEFVPAPATMFRDILKLPAGHTATLRGGDLEVGPFWDLRMGGGAPARYGEAVERLRALLDEAVASHLVSDVPLGVFLSGGLDSSAIVAMMRRHVPGRLRTFTIGYPDKSFSELDYAQIVAERFGTDHTVLMIDDLQPRYIEESLWHLDEPMTDLSTVPLFLVCREARRHVTVCLSGEGGDESFAGYDRFKASRINRLYALLPRALREGVVAPLAARLPDQPQKKGALNMFKRFIEGASLPSAGEHLRWQFFLDAARHAPLFGEAFRRAVDPDTFRLCAPWRARCAGADAVNREVYLDMRFMMTDSVLMKVDKMSMASALEIRVPLLDHELVEYVASLPGNWKLKGLTTKRILRSALEGILPDRIVRRGKQGYSLPVKHLLRERLKPYLVERLHSSAAIRENMDMAYVDRLIEEHGARVHNHNHLLWALLSVAIWHDRFGVTT